jgi:hypothetical protein
MMRTLVFGLSVGVVSVSVSACLLGDVAGVGANGSWG